jgi:deoxycytidine triphosphate deaminase
VAKPAAIVLKRGSHASIWSMEGFELSERVLAIFGHSSALFSRGLELIHSPFIDPAFKGQLQLVVRNFTDHEVTLTPGDVIGKIVFFDISDTVLSAEDLLEEVQRNAQNVVRQNAIKELSHAMGNIQSG